MISLLNDSLCRQGNLADRTSGFCSFRNNLQSKLQNLPPLIPAGESREENLLSSSVFEFSMPSNLFNALFCIGIIGIKEIRLIWKFVARKEWIGIFSRIERLFEGAK